MIVNSSNHDSDPRVMCGIIACAALERFEKKSPAEKSREIYFANFIRLLEMYRYDALHEHNPHGILERENIPSVELSNNNDGLDVVRNALSHAHTDIFPHMNKDEVVTHLRTYLETIMQNGISNIDNQDDLDQIIKFIKRFKELLADS